MTFGKPGLSSLATRLTLITLGAFLLGVWSLAFYAGRTLQDDMQRQLGEQQLSTVAIVAAEVAQSLLERSEALQVIATRVAIAMERDSAQARRPSGSVQTVLDERPLFQKLFNQGIFVARTDGTVIADVPLKSERFGKNVRDLNYMDAVLKDGGPVFSLSGNRDAGSTGFVISVPVHDARGAWLGVVIGMTDMTQPNFLDRFSRNTYGTSGGFMIVAPQSRTIVAATKKRLAMSHVREAGADPLIDRFMQGFEGSGVLVNPLGVEMLASAKRIPVAGWYIAAALPAEEAFAPIRRLQMRLLLAAIALTLLLGGVTWWLVRRQFAPLRAAAKDLATASLEGQFPQALKTARQDEIGMLINSINRLLETVSKREVALRESRERFDLAVRGSSDGIWDWNIQTGEIFVSERWCELLGYRREELDVSPTVWKELIHPDEREPAVDQVLGHLKNKRLYAMESRMRTRNGEYRWFLVRGQALWDARGRAVRMAGSMTDITQRRLSVDTARLSEEKFSKTFYASPDWIVLSKLETGEFLEVNEGFTLISGYQRDKVIGRSSLDLGIWWDKAQRSALVDSIAAGVPVRNVEVAFRMESGAQRLIQLSMVPLDVGDEKCLISVGRDITENKRTDALLREYKAIVDASTDAIVSKSLDGTIRSWNPGAENIFGYSAEEAIGNSIQMIIPAERADEEPEIMARLCKGERVEHIETLRRHKNGQLIYISATISPIFDAGGKVIGASKIARNITERKRAESAQASLEAQLRESQKMEAIGTLAGGIAHDFNNIIASILGNAELARVDGSDNADVLESVDEIRKAATRARDLVRQILSFSRRQPVELMPCALPPIVGEAVRLLRVTLPARCRLELHCDPDVPRVLADATQIEQVLINLATNAAQAMAERPGLIRVRLDTALIDAAVAGKYPELHELYRDAPGRMVRLAVSDDGQGMDAGTLARIFEPFFTTKAVDKGTGLGLAVVHGIVRSHGGAIVAESTPGQGAIFTIYLPIAVAQAGAAQTDAGAPATPADGGGGRVLYLDDDRALASMMKRLLEKRGIRVSVHTEPDEALAALRADAAGFDLVVSDYNMPEMSGLDVAFAVRAIRADLPVAIISGFIDENLRARAGDAGVMELIHKGVGVEELCATVQRLARGGGEKC